MNPRSCLLVAKNGQSLIEVVIALGVVVVLAVSLVSTSLITQRTARSAKNNTQASKLVQENIEQLRVVRDRQGFPTLANRECATLNTANADPSLWTIETSSCPDGEQLTLDNTDFRRKFSIGPDPLDLSNSKKKQIIVSVFWQDTGGPQEVSNVTNLSDCIVTSVAC